MTGVHTLCTSAALELFAGCLLGAFLLIPMQPRWQNARWAAGVRNMKALHSVHLDLLMLALMQFAAAFAMTQLGPHCPSPSPSLSPSALAPDPLPAWEVSLLVFGGWANPLPYLFRAYGINAFALTGPWYQRLAAGLGAASSAALLVAWGVLLRALWVS